MLKFFLIFPLIQYFLAQKININNENVFKSFTSNKNESNDLILNTTHFFSHGNTNNVVNSTSKTSENFHPFDQEKNAFKRKESDQKIPEDHERTFSNSKEDLDAEQKVLENQKKNILIDFDLIVNEFLNFEPKTGEIEFDAKVKYKWWSTKSSITSSTSSSEIEEDLLTFKNYHFSPIIKFLDSQSVKLVIKNQLYSFNNVETFFERKRETQQSLLAKFEKFKTNNNKAVSAALLSNSNDVYMMSSYKNVSSNKKILMSKVSRHYSCLEQNVTLKFKCKTDGIFDSLSSSIDTSNFPFDTHACELNFDIIASLSGSNSKLESSDLDKPVFSFASLVPDDPNKIEIDNNLFEFYSYNKLVQTSSNYSWISREWLLKKITMLYSNQTTVKSGTYLSRNLNISSEFHEKLDHYLMSRKDLINNSITSQIQSSSSSYDKLSSLLPRVGVTFYVARRREPQVYIFVLPLVLFTLITFLIFFLPTSNTSEKTLIAFLNFACMLGYNIYLFKLVIYTYDFMRMPLILQYSNCLMVIQLGVLAYTCLVKSVYHYGFLTFNASSFTNLAEDTFKQMYFMNQDHLTQHENEKYKNQNLASLVCGHLNHGLDIYSHGDNNVTLNQLVSQSNSRSSTGSNNMFNKCDEKIQEETGVVIYHGCEQLETGTECNINRSDTNNSQTNLNKSTESINKRLSSVGFLKLEDSVDDVEGGGAIKIIKNNLKASEGNSPYQGLNHIEPSINMAGTGSKCVCNARETDADCCNSEIELGQILNCNGDINTGTGTTNDSCAPNAICNNDPEKNRLIALKSDFLRNLNLNKYEQHQRESISNNKQTEITNTCRNAHLANGNWMLTKFCCGGGHEQQSNPKYSKNCDKHSVYSPSPICEHVRSVDTHKRQINSNFNDIRNNQQKCSLSSCASSNSTTRQLLPHPTFQTHDCYDYTSHLVQAKDTKICNLKCQKNNPNKTVGSSCSPVLKQNKLSCLPLLKNDFFQSQLCQHLQQQNRMNQMELRNASLTSGNQMSKLNLNMQKLVKIEELFVREKILRDEWKRKARLCDGICCLFVFFLLIICSSFIFIILPNVKTSSLID